MNALPPDLTRLAQEAGVLTSYHDVSGKEQVAGTEALLAVFRSLGINLDSPEQAGTAMRELQATRARQVLDPVVVHWLGESTHLALRIPSSIAQQSLEMAMTLEVGGERLVHSARTGDLVQFGRLEGVDGTVELRQVTLPWNIPPGYHTLEIEIGNEKHSAFVISAPPKAATSPGRGWGVFAPLYALRSDRNWGIGDLRDLATLANSAGELGAELIGTLPLYATFLDHPCNPSPYAPCSRLFWNEAFIDIESVPEWSTCAEARQLAESAAFQKALSRLRSTRHVDHRSVMQRKRAVLEAMCRELAEGSSPRAVEFKRVLLEDERLLDYCRFRAAMEKAGDVWQTWPDRQRSGALGSADYDESDVEYHAYVQWVTRTQLDHLTRQNQPGPRLYLDLPLGVHPSGYDVYRHQSLFMQGSSAGAPPDLLFSGGQDWGFPPLHPWRLQTSRYEYVSAVLRNTLHYAAALRVDHVMGLHRLFVIPQGASAREGVYVRYPAEEQYAVLLLEAHRSHCQLLVGEDLGTVPDEVRQSMDRRSLARMFVWQYELEPTPEHALKPVPAGQVASLNTHDMPTFTGFNHGTDVNDRFRLGLISAGEADQEKLRRQDMVARGAEALRGAGWLSGRVTSRSLLSASLAYLAGSAARLVIVSLEDLWLEAEPQNVPGTYLERPNWMRKARYTLEKGLEHTVVRNTLKRINSLRKQKPAGD